MDVIKGAEMGVSSVIKDRCPREAGGSESERGDGSGREWWRGGERGGLTGRCYAAALEVEEGGPQAKECRWLLETQAMDLPLKQREGGQQASWARWRDCGQRQRGEGCGVSRGVWAAPRSRRRQSSGEVVC